MSNPKGKSNPRPDRKSRPQAAIPDGDSQRQRPTPTAFAALSRGQLIVIAWAAGVATICGVAAVVGVAYLLFFQTDAGIEQQPLANHQPSAAHVPLEPDTDLLESAEQKPGPTTPRPLPDPEPRPPKRPEPAEMAATDNPEEVTRDEADRSALPLYNVIEVLHEHLPLPATLQNRSLSGDGNIALEASARLAEVYVDDLEKISLSIIGADVVLPQGIKFTINPSINNEHTTKTWAIAETNPLAVSALGTPIGEFRLKDHALSFEWAQNLRSARLKYCRLQIDAENTHGKQTAKCSLTEPIEQEPLRLDFDDKLHRTELQIDPRSLPDSRHLRMEIQVRGIDNDRFTVNPQRPFQLTSNEDSTDPSSSVTMEFLDPDENGQDQDKLIHVEGRVVEQANEPPVFSIKNFAYPTQISWKGKGTPDFPPPLVVAMSQEPIEFARSSEETTRRTISKVKVDIKKGHAALAKVIRERAELLSRAKAAGPNFKSEQDTAQRELDEAEKRKRNYEDAMAEAERFDEWYSHLESVYRDLEENIEIDFRLYITVDGVETDILRGRSTGVGPSRPNEPY